MPPRTNVERVERLITELWSGDDDNAPSSQRIKLWSKHFALTYVQFWPKPDEGHEPDPDDDGNDEIEFDDLTDNQIAAIVLLGFRFLATSVVNASRIKAAEVAARLEEKEDIDNEDPLPPIDLT